MFRKHLDVFSPLGWIVTLCPQNLGWARFFMNTARFKRGHTCKSSFFTDPCLPANLKSLSLSLIHQPLLHRLNKLRLVCWQFVQKESHLIWATFLAVTMMTIFMSTIPIPTTLTTMTQLVPLKQQMLGSTTQIWWRQNRAPWLMSTISLRGTRRKRKWSALNAGKSSCMFTSQSVLIRPNIA